MEVSMSMIRNVVAASLLLLAISTAVPAADDAAPKKKLLNPWIDCGIGAMIFDETTWAAVSSNIIWDLGTTAVTSDQSSQHTCNSKNAKVAKFIGVTYASLEEETVKGDGQHLHAMLNIMGCDASAHANIISEVRTDLGKSMRNAAYLESAQEAKAEAYYNIVQTRISEGHATQCQLL
jgi:hypothetical protein